MRSTVPQARYSDARAFTALLISFLMLVTPITPAVAASVTPGGTIDTGSTGAAAAEAAAGPVALGLSPEPLAALPLAASVTATKTDAFPDADGDGKAAPGETITYTVTITNNGPDDATGVTFSDTVDANTTLVNGSVNTTPVAIDDAYSAVGNVSISVPDGAGDLLSNDCNPDSGVCNGTGLTASGSATSTNGGNVVVNADGSFSYDPPAGFSGTDTFTYTVTDGQMQTDEGTVTITVGNPIWFIDDSAAAGGDGRLASPFNCYTGASDGTQTCFSDTAADEAGDVIFLFSGNYTGGNGLLNNQKLIGQGASDTLATLAGVTTEPYSTALPATGGAAPVITTNVAATHAIPLGQGNLLRGFNIGATTGAKISGSNFGTLTVGNNTSPDVSLSGGGRALNLTNGTFAATSAFSSVATTSSSTQGILLSQVAGTVSFGSTTVSGSTGPGIFVQNSTADINFGNTSVSGGSDGVALMSNTGGTRTFGTLTITGSTGAGILHTVNGGAVNVTGATAITNPGGTGIDIQGSLSAVTFAATTVNKSVTAGVGVNFNNNTGTTTFSSLAVTTSNGAGLNATGGGTINVTNAAGSSISATGVGTTFAPAISATGITTFGANFTSLSSTNSGGVGTGITLNGTAGSMTSATTNIQNPGGIGINVVSSGAALNFGSTTVNGSGGDAVELSSNTGAITFSALNLTPDAGLRGLDAANNTGTITSTSGSISTTDAVAVNVSSSSLNMALTSVSADNTGTAHACVSLSSATGTLTMNGGSLTGGGAAAFLVSGGTVSSTYNGTVTQTTGGQRAVDVQSKTGGTHAFGGLITASTTTANAVHLVSNSGATVNFTGGLSLTTTSGVGFNATGGGTVNATQNNTTILNTVSTSTGTGVNIATPSNIGGSGVTFRSVSVNGAPSGIVLNGTTGAFMVAGDGSTTSSVLDRDGSGGTLNNTTDDAVRLTNASNVTLRQMNINSPGDTVDPDIDDNENTVGEHGIEAIGGSNIIISAVLIDSPSASGMIARNLTGTNRLNQNSLVTNIDNPATHGLFIRNGSGFNLTLFEVNDTDFTNSSSGASTINVKNDGTANMTVEVRNGCIFEALGGQAVTMDAGGTAGTTGTVTSLVTGNTFRNAIAFETAPGSGIFVTTENNVAALVANGALHNATISNNLFDNIAEDGRVANTSIIRTQNAGGRLNAVVSGNTIQNINYTSSGAGGRHVIGLIDEPGIYNAANFSNIRIENNTATNVTYTNTNREFIVVDYRGPASNGDVKILGNNWNMPTSASTSEAVELRFRQTNASTVDLQVDNNGQGTGAIHNTGSRFLNIDAEAAATVNATVTNNRFTNNNAMPGAAIDFETEAASSTMCVNVSGNNVTAAGNTIRLVETAGTMNVTQANLAAVSSANNGASATVAGTTPNFGQPACALPSNALETSEFAEPMHAPAETLGVASLEEATVAAASHAAAEAAPVVNTDTNDAADGGRQAESLLGEVISRPFVSFAGQLQTALLKLRQGFTHSERAQALSVAAREANAPPAAAARAAAPVVTLSGETVNVNIGTIPAGETVTITFQVTVNDPLPQGTMQVANQGTVSGSNFTSTLTDDPDTMSANDPTVTPVLSPPDIRINDAKAVEPVSGTAQALFTVTLSNPFSSAVSVNFATADDSATAGTDYTATNGTVTFGPGETFKSISVPVLADGDSESDETFFVNISGEMNGIVVDAQAVGTITETRTPGAVLISELRTSGPAGAGDDFVELYNNTDSPASIGGWALVKMGADCDAAPVVVASIPMGTMIPARGNYLLVGSQYSLANYGGTGAAAGDQTLTTDIEADANVALFNTADVTSLGSTAVSDAIGFGSNTGGNCDLLREGTNLPGAAGSASEHSFVRKVEQGATLDVGDNSSDLVVVSTTPAMPVGNNMTPLLGAPGPERSTSPVGPVPCAPNPVYKIGRALLDTNAATDASPNRARDLTPGAPETSAAGTLEFRRTFTNNTGGSLTALRFRLVDLTTLNSPVVSSPQADLRALSSATGMVTLSDTTTMVSVMGTTLEQPPTQAGGGGVNSTLAPVSGLPLADGASVNLRFLFGVQQTGNYRVGFVIETLASNGATGQDIWVVTGHTDTGGDAERACNAPPVVDAGDDQEVECENGSATVTLTGEATDPEGDLPLTFAWFEGATPLGTGESITPTLPFGTHTITLRVTDSQGNVGTDEVVVDVVDTMAPTFTATPPPVTLFTGEGATSCSVTVSDLDAALGTATATDSCGGSNVMVERLGVPAMNVFPLGETIITYKATDAAGNMATAMQTVTVVDNTDPTIMAPADLTNVSADANSCEATNVSLGTPMTSDNCPLPMEAVTNDAPASFPLGTTTVTWTVTDGAGNTATATQTVTVVDTQAPTVTAPANVTLQTGAEATSCGLTVSDLDAALGTAMTSDNCTGTVTVVRLVGGNPITSSHTFPVGMTTVTYKATDAAGNMQTATQVVTVADNAPPAISCPMDIFAIPGMGGTAVVNYSVGATDNCPGVMVNSNPPSGSTFPTGTTTVNATATDAAGNTAMCSFNVTVGSATLTVVSPAEGQYSDSVTLQANVTPVTPIMGSPLTGNVQFFVAGNPVGSAPVPMGGGTASLSYSLLPHAAGMYNITAQFTSTNPNYLSSSGGPATLTVNKEKTATDYTGDESILTAGPSITTATVRLAAHLTQEADGAPGDITLAGVRFYLFKSSNLSNTPDLVVPALASPPLAPDAAGDVLTTVTLAADTWTIKVKVDSANQYWMHSNVALAMLNITVPTNEQRSSGGGWVPDAESASGRGNFGFTISLGKGKNPGLRGNSNFIFRGLDGFDYLVKSNSWQGGYLQFSAEPGVSPDVFTRSNFRGRCTVQKIDPATGEIVESFGNFTFEVFTKDGDLLKPRQEDAYSITVWDTNDQVFHQVGSGSSLVLLGGGNINNKIK